MNNTVILEVKKAFKFDILNMKKGDRVRATKTRIMGIPAYLMQFKGEDFYYSVDEFEGASVSDWYEVLPEDGGEVLN